MNEVVLVELAGIALGVEEQVQDGFLVGFLSEVKKARLLANIHLNWEVYYGGFLVACFCSIAHCWFSHFQRPRQAQVAGVQWLVL